MIGGVIVVDSVAEIRILVSGLYAVLRMTGIPFDKERASQK